MSKHTRNYNVDGVGFGVVLAMVISFGTHHSVGWAIFHALCNWFYVIYFLIVH